MTNAQRTKQFQDPNDKEEWDVPNEPAESEALILREGEEPRKFDLEERTARFGEAVVRFCKTIPTGPIATPLISQLVRAGTSVGANFCEADNAVSKKEFGYA